jgi:uncharacterized protein YjbI with pentapeptide repeats
MGTHKRRLAVLDDDGTHLKAVYVEPDANGFEGADLSGLAAIGVRNLRGTSFRGTILYWANLSDADLSGCDLTGADLRGAVLQGTKLVGANLRGAKLCRDALGGTTNLRGADLTEATLEGAELAGAEYDDETRFPSGFSPAKAGCLHVDAS